MGVPARLTFGLVPPPSFVGFEPRLNALMRFIGAHAGVTLVRRHVGSYDELVRALRGGTIDVAWLPPSASTTRSARRPATSGEPAMLDAIRTTFGAMSFVRKPVVGYDLLRTEIEHGVDSGVIPAAAAFLSTKPPPGGF